MMKSVSVMALLFYFGWISTGTSQKQLSSLSVKNRFFAVTKPEMDWESAYVHCRRKKGSLATIETEEENKVVLELIRKTGIHKSSFWVGGTDLTSEGEWIWSISGHPVEGYTYWLEDNPNNADNNQHCMSYWEYTQGKGYRWNDDYCTTKHPFICEY